MIKSLHCHDIFRIILALSPKTAFFQIRIDPLLLQRFQAMCDEKTIVPSDFARRLIAHQCDSFEKAKASALQKPSAPSLAASQSSFPPVSVTTHVKATSNASSASPALQKAREKREKKRSR
jgi:hypothetical protein